MNDPQADSERPFLDHFAQTRRGPVFNWFLYAIRQGSTTPEAVVNAVREDMESRLIGPIHYDPDGHYTYLLNMMAEHRDQALELAGYALDWEALDPQEKARIKTYKARYHERAWKSNQPPTDKQVRYLRHLGYTGEVKSKAHASDLIEQHKNQARMF